MGTDMTAQGWWPVVADHPHGATVATAPASPGLSPAPGIHKDSTRRRVSAPAPAAPTTASQGRAAWAGRSHCQ